MPEPRRPQLRAGLAGAGLAIAAGLFLHQTATATRASGGAPVACIEARGRSALAADFAAIAYIRHPLGLANHLGRAPRRL